MNNISQCGIEQLLGDKMNFHMWKYFINILLTVFFIYIYKYFDHCSQLSTHYELAPLLMSKDTFQYYTNFIQ